jgi:putative membrane protein
MKTNKLAALLALAITFTTSAAYAASSHAFLKTAIEGDNSEMRLGALAEKKGASQGVRDFGHMLNTDHAEAKQQAVAVAQGIGMTPPTSMAPEAKLEYAKLDLLSGPAFDHEFVSYMVKDHKKDISAFEKQAKSGDTKTADLAKETLPVLRKHLETAESLEHS